jgi:hypothetical protein
LRHELLIQPHIESLRIARSLKEKGRSQFFAVQSGDQAGARTAIAGAEAVNALSAQGVTVVPLRRALKAGFIDVNKSTALPRKIVMALEIATAIVFIV